jgi:tetratricopeptide (TPR) repeat protein
MIVRNEERYLPDCLRSVHGVVDEIVIVDTGSTDRTLPIAEESGARIGHHEWGGDFAGARNVALGLCTGDWILQLDADEELRATDRARIREVIQASEAGGLIMLLMSQTRSGGALVPAFSRAVRLFRRTAGVAYRGMVHESVADSIAESGARIEQSELVIVHKGYECSEEELKRKKLRNLEILTMQREKQPGEPHTLLKLAETLISLDRMEEAGEIVKVALDLMANEKTREEAKPRLAHLFLADAQIAMWKHDWPRASRSLMQSLEIAPNQLQGRWLLSKVYEQAGRFDQAVQQILRMLETAGQAGMRGVSLEVDVWHSRAELRYRLGVLCRKAGESTAAESHLRAALDEEPSHLPAVLSLAALYLDRGEFALGLECLENAHRLSPQDRRILSLRDRVIVSMESRGQGARPERVV